ncbi:MAG: hypothetical protein AABW50_05300 [Nanoarchaeota archaeon]
MVFTIGKNIEEILENSLKNRNLAEHLRLLGFHNITNRQQLDRIKVESYVEKEKLEQHKPFTALTSGNIMLKFKDLVNERKLSSLHLPISNNYHLMLFLVDENEFTSKILYDSCEKCKLVAPYKFPIIELRRSIELPIFKGPILYDNRVSILEQDRDLLLLQYGKFEDFINKTKVE